MNCDVLYQRLTDHREGTLDASLCEAIERHLGECSPCGELRQDLEDLARICREARQAACMPADVRQRIETLLRADT